MARPTGSVADVHKVRRDYRFALETMQAITDGLAIFAGSLKETAFVERAIGHYTRFLQGDPEALGSLTGELEELLEQIQLLHTSQQATEGVALHAADTTTDQALEVERLQGQIRNLEQQRVQEQREAQARLRDLEQQLRISRESARILDKQLTAAQAALPKPVEKKLDLRKAYQILIRHEPRQECPKLPEGFAYDANDMTSAVRSHNWAQHDSPVHTVFNQQWPIARVRREVERLKSVPGIIRIWIAKNGEAVTIVSGVPSDSWTKEGGKWSKD